MAEKCPRCRGCGKIADSDEGEPWSYWMELPVQSALAVVVGIVKPIPCPACGGAGVTLNPKALPDLFRACRAAKMLLGPRLDKTDDFDDVFVQLSEALTKARGYE